MSKTKALILFVVAAIIAWVAAYAPEMVRNQKTLDALDAPIARWVCVINGDAVSSHYEAYVTKRYIMLGGQRFYSDEFRKWGRGADYMLVVIDDNQFVNWKRLDLSETDYYAREYGIKRAGCRRMLPGDRATNVTVPVTPPLNDGVYGGPGPQGPGYTTPGATSNSPGTTSGGSGSSFDWGRAVGPALGPQGGSSDGTPGANAPSPAPSDGGVR